MKKLLLSRITWFALGLLIALGGTVAYYEGYFEPLPAAIECTTSIEVTEEGMKGMQTIRIDSAVEVERIVDSISYMPKLSCKCDHVDWIVFHTPNGKVKASVCNHCLDLTMDGVTESYRMPESLMNALKQAVKNDSRQWYITAWKMED